MSMVSTTILSPCPIDFGLLSPFSKHFSLHVPPPSDPNIPQAPARIPCETFGARAARGHEEAVHVGREGLAGLACLEKPWDF